MAYIPGVVDQGDGQITDGDRKETPHTRAHVHSFTHKDHVRNNFFFQYSDGFAILKSVLYTLISPTLQAQRHVLFIFLIVWDGMVSYNMGFDFSTVLKER